MLFVKNTNELYNDYCQQMQRIADLRYAGAVLQWDQETYLPKNGAHFRGQQLATISELAHQYFTQPQFGEQLTTLSQRADLNAQQQKNIALSLYDFNKNAKLPATFVRQQSEQITKSYHAWVQARKEKNAALFLPHLDALINLKKQEAAYLGYQNHPYNALLNDYEKGSNVARLDAVFGQLVDPLKALLQQVLAKQATAAANPLAQHFNKEQQWAFCTQVLSKMGFDFESGRQDVSEHPFTTSFSPQDVRITTRINEQDLGYMTWSTLHELGHAWYEQGLPTAQYGLPLGEACSLSMHESQSRFWENCIGRSLPFCEWILPIIATYFPQQMQGVTAMQLYQAINQVQPSLIRTEADELTYHFHVIIRYQIEKQIMAGDLKTADIPQAWNQLYANYLGVNVPSDDMGFLQDIHWSHGSFGYFATYSLGSMYGVQLYNQAQTTLPNMDDLIKKGDFKPILNWLNQNVHQHGRQLESDELCTQICGEGLNSTTFITYLTHKYLNKV
jgi:carboxypeptidase Taq